MAIADRIAINSSGVVYYDSTAGAHDHTAATAEYYSVIDWHRFLQDLADDAVASGDDLIDITSDTPSDRSTDNIITLKTGYTLDDGTVGGGDPVWEHLFDGSILQEGDSREWHGLVVIAGEGMDLQIMQNGALVANDFWNSIPNGETTKGLNRDAANGISHRFMLETIDGTGTDIDGRRIIGMTRENFNNDATGGSGKTYSEFKVNGTSRGNNVLALTFANDLNDSADASGFSTITNTEGYREIDIDGNGTVEPYYSEWNRDTYSTNQLTQRLKYLTRRGETTTIYGIQGQIFRGITHEIPLNSGSQSVTDFSAVEAVSWATGTGQMLAVDDVNAATKMWIQILTGVAPAAASVTITGGTSTATIDTSGAAVEQTVSAPFFGVSTGAAVIGGFGFALESADTSASDLFTDLNGNTNQPPNNVTFSVGGLVSSEDRVLVGPANGSLLRDDQMQVAAAEAITVTAGSVSSATAGAGTVVMDSGTETIGTGTNSEKDTLTAGTIRVLDANGIYQIINYTGYSDAAGELTFTGCTATGTWSASATNAAFLSYVDKLAGATTESYTVVYNADRALFIRVRDGGTAGDAEGIKTFETTGTLGSGGGSTTAIRTSDV